VRFVGVRRLAAGAVGVVVAATAAWWLVRPAAAPVEVAIPAATRATIGEVAPTTTVATMLRVHVAGAVKRPGVYSLAAGARVVDAVRAAGGASDSADLERINLAQTLLDTEQVMVPRRGSTRVTVAPRHVPRRRAPSTTTTTLPTETGGGTSATPSSPAGAVNLNTAGVDQLDTLPGIGPATAKAIVSHRTRKGPFSRVEDLLAIDGIGPKKLDAIRDLVSL
jgi:competence protein ComEA